MARLRHTPWSPVAGQQGYTVAIRHNPSGEVRTIQYPYDWEFDAEYPDGPYYSHHHYLWTEGNYGCDCNLALFFYNWGPESDDRDCGETKFSVLYAELPDGRRIKFSED